MRWSVSVSFFESCLFVYLIINVFTCRQVMPGRWRCLLRKEAASSRGLNPKSASVGVPNTSRITCTCSSSSSSSSAGIVSRPKKRSRGGQYTSHSLSWCTNYLFDSHLPTYLPTYLPT